MEAYGERADVSKLYIYHVGDKLQFTKSAKNHGERKFFPHQDDFF
jgi:hypothetical protein